MKQVKFLAAICVAGSMLLSACNSGGDKKADNPADSSAVKKDTTAATPVTPTSVEGPKMIMSIIHKVGNFEKWLPGYEGHDSARLANGLHNYVIGRELQDSNNVLVALKMDDADKAKAMAASPEMKQRMKQSGVTGPATINYIETVLSDATPVESKMRVLVRHKVKDWDAWKKVFDADKPNRVAAGLIDRVVGHTVGDTHDVSIVLVITDMDKAKAFMNSKTLQDAMKAGGVEGKPTSFMYSIYKKY